MYLTNTLYCPKKYRNKCVDFIETTSTTHIQWTINPTSDTNVPAKQKSKNLIINEPSRSSWAELILCSLINESVERLSFQTFQTYHIITFLYYWFYLNLFFLNPKDSYKINFLSSFKIIYVIYLMWNLTLRMT
jgi:hypothetical protein